MTWMLGGWGLGVLEPEARRPSPLVEPVEGQKTVIFIDFPNENQ